MNYPTAVAHLEPVLGETHNHSLVADPNEATLLIQGPEGTHSFELPGQFEAAVSFARHQRQVDEAENHEASEAR